MREEILSTKIQDIKVVYTHCKVIIATVFRSLAQDKDGYFFVFILKIKSLFKNDRYTYRYKNMPRVPC